jgi:hypothetical protein
MGETPLASTLDHISSAVLDTHPRHVHQFASKAKVSPIYHLSIVKKEHSASCASVTLANDIERHHKRLDSTNCSTESEVALKWIRNHPQRRMQHVAVHQIDTWDTIIFPNWRNAPTNCNRTDHESKWKQLPLDCSEHRWRQVPQSSWQLKIKHPTDAGFSLTTRLKFLVIQRNEKDLRNASAFECLILTENDWNRYTAVISLRVIFANSLAATLNSSRQNSATNSIITPNERETTMQQLISNVQHEIWPDMLGRLIGGHLMVT